jgi:hypothetical protein
MFYTSQSQPTETPVALLLSYISIDHCNVLPHVTTPIKEQNIFVYLFIPSYSTGLFSFLVQKNVLRTGTDLFDYLEQSMNLLSSYLVS